MSAQAPPTGACDSLLCRAEFSLMADSSACPRLTADTGTFQRLSCLFGDFPGVLYEAAWAQGPTCFADKPGKVNWQMPSQTRQEKPRLNRAEAGPLRWLMAALRLKALTVLGSGTWRSEGEESRENPTEPGRRRGRRKAFIWEGSPAARGRSGHFSRQEPPHEL